MGAEKTVIGFSRIFEKELSTKIFASEDDRLIVKGIVLRYLTNRLLHDAVENQSVIDVKRYLLEFSNECLNWSLNDAIDKSMNTLLHVAVKHTSVEIVVCLLKANADPKARNVRGDTPSQIFMLPRLGKNSQ